MAILPSLPGLQIDIRPHDTDEDSFPEYNPGTEELPPAEWPENFDPELEGGPMDTTDRVVCLDDDDEDEEDEGPVCASRKRKRAAPQGPLRGRRAARTQAAIEESVCTRYIPAHPGTGWRVCLTFLPTFIYRDYDIEVLVSVDGKLMESRLFAREEFEDEDAEGWKEFIEGFTVERDVPGGVGGSLGRERVIFGWLFAGLDVDASSNQKVRKSMKDKMRSLGKITVQLRRVTNCAIAKEWEPPKIMSRLKRVPEEALKGKAVSLRAINNERSFQRVKKPKPVLEAQSLEPPGRPYFATFNFCYRTMDDLKKLGLIPRDKSIYEKKFHELTDEEMRELALRQHQRETLAYNNDVKPVKEEEKDSIIGPETIGRVGTSCNAAPNGSRDRPWEI